MTTEQVVIIGGGPAGIAAALECRRQGYDPLVIEKARLGGLLLNANWVENYPGFPDGITGLALAENFRRQAEQKQVRVMHQEVTRLSHENGRFRIETNENTLEARYVIVASGTKPKTIEDLVSGEMGYERVYYEVYPIRDIQGKKVVIIGAGDAAFDFALNLAKKNQVVIINRGGGVRCAPHLWQKASANDSIAYYQNIQVMLPCEYLNGKISVTCAAMCDGYTLVADYLLVAVGRTAQLDFVTDELLGDSENLRQEGKLFFVGDVKNGDFRQTGIAVGEGIMAAMKICHSLKEAR